MVINIQDELAKVQAMGLLDKLLMDKSTRRRIMWATGDFAGCGPRYGRNEPITPELITGANAGVIEIQARKEDSRQQRPVSPQWLCRKLCDYADELRPAGWQKYVDGRVLELTCAEAPFLASRYDMETGVYIPVSDRYGLLDRKLRAVNENVHSEDAWLHWVFRAFGATYGYEFRGDRLLIARVNFLMTFVEYLWERWKRKPTLSEYGRVINLITWNLWQMDALTGRIPYGTAEEEFQQLDFFTDSGEDAVSAPEGDQPNCRVYNWTGEGSAEYLELPVKGKHAMKFALVVGNPPYQEETIAGRRTLIPSAYRPILDKAYQIADRAVLLHPARFLVDAGSAPRAWSNRLLHDPHLKVLWYESDSKKVFPGMDITGGVTITCWDITQDFRRPESFNAFPELSTILEKVSPQETDSMMQMVCEPLCLCTSALCAHYPEDMPTLGSDVFGKLSVFSTERRSDSDVAVLGMVDGKREWRYLPREFVEGNTQMYKVAISAVNGASGTLGKAPARIIGRPLLVGPGAGAVQPLTSVGPFETEAEARACMKYMRSRFARTLLGVLKVTRELEKSVWKYVPLQNFTSDSDIDWSRPVPEIDWQLYKKYGLDGEEIRFIESHVRELS